MNRRLLDDCFLHDQERLTHAQTLDILKSRLQPIAEISASSLIQAAGKILAETQLAPRPIPAHTNAAVDGYAFAHSDYDQANGCTMSISARVTAGHPLTTPPVDASAVRIFTGAPMPEGMDSVVMQEDINLTSEGDREFISIPAGLKAGANCRLAGEDTEENQVLVEAGVRLRPQEIARLASGGIGTVPVFAPLKVAVFSTGDELLRQGDQFTYGKVYDSNAPMLEALALHLPISVTDLGILRDEKDHVKSVLKEAAQNFDLLLTSGGASRGEEDHIISALDELGQRHLWQLAIKPGRPMSFGQIDDAIFIGLPGNPVAAFVCFLLYVQPVILRLGGGAWFDPKRYPLPAGFEIKSKKTNRREFLRGKLINTKSGLHVEKFEFDGSGLIASLCAADGLIEVGEDVSQLARGDLVDFIPFSEFGLSTRL